MFGGRECATGRWRVFGGQSILAQVRRQCGVVAGTRVRVRELIIRPLQEYEVCLIPTFVWVHEGQPFEVSLAKLLRFHIRTDI